MPLEFKERGYVTLEELEALGLLPPKERLEKGPVAILECPEQIPCNICVDSCPQGAIRMERITDLPMVDWDKCVGCASCVAVCPGLAAFVVDLTVSDNKAHVTLPYEFLPEPRVGLEVELLGRDGSILGKGRVVKCWERNRTWVVTVEVPRELAMDVRGIRIPVSTQ